MCGIAGVATFNQISRDTIEKMIASMNHRGPDGSGVWLSPDSTVGLGHRRLAIIDLTTSASQPMVDSTKHFCIVFNGEIYNYKDLKTQLENLGCQFNSESDTEVLLEAFKVWGADCLTRIHGAFSFCIYDQRRKVLFLARDRAGEKPLFYSFSRGNFVFASELKAIMSIPGFSRRISHEALSSYLCYGYVPGEMCILSGVNKVPPAHAMEIDCESWERKIWRYWSIPSPDHKALCDAEELKGRLLELLRTSVQRQMIADVPIGILLSGGVDSSLITAVAASGGATNLRTFTVSFPGHKEYDESMYAKIVARHFSTQHTVLEASQASADILPELAAQFDEPIADSSMVPTYMVAKLVKQCCTVALGGDGGDELFGGYPTYSWLQNQQIFRSCCPAFFRSGISKIAENFLPVGLKGRTNLMGLSDDLCNSINYFNVLFDRRPRESLLKGHATMSEAGSFMPEKVKQGLYRPEYGVAGSAMLIDFLTYLPDNILVKVDRTSMLNSLEMRAPFLDHSIIEFAFGEIPDALRATRSDRKILLKSLCRDLLPANLDITRKQGFIIPLKDWLSGEWGHFFKEVLFDKHCVFNREMVESLWKWQQMGLRNTERLFALTIFELWRKHYQVSL